uniref:Uncharacterized protein n=1 Tax=Arundo donax TaxID=35708 RepID=A0A0A9E2M5_ARUDO
MAALRNLPWALLDPRRDEQGHRGIRLFANWNPSAATTSLEGSPMPRAPLHIGPSPTAGVGGAPLCASVAPTSMRPQPLPRPQRSLQRPTLQAWSACTWRWPPSTRRRRRLPPSWLASCGCR